jgi:hypothetical protein
VLGFPFCAESYDASAGCRISEAKLGRLANSVEELNWVLSKLLFGGSEAMPRGL